MLVPIAGSADDDHKGEGQEEEGDKENYKDQKRHKGATHHHHDGKATGESSSSSSDATQVRGGGCLNTGSLGTMEVYRQLLNAMP